MTSSKVAVQPPPRARKAQTLYPPVIVKQSVHIEPGAQYFATAALLNEGDVVVEGILVGTKAATGYELDVSSSGSSTLVYAFSDLSISKSGSYTIRVDLYKYSAESPAGAILHEQLETNKIAVSSRDVPSHEPSAKEKSLMRKAKDAGIIPRS